MLSGRYRLRWFGLMTIGMSVVVVTFYIVQPTINRNYGGVSSGLRWVFWLYPLWLGFLVEPEPVGPSVALSDLAKWIAAVKDTVRGAI